MNETITGLKRTHYCGELRAADAGREVVLFGWCQRRRDLGGLIFLDLRDRTGLVQLAFDDQTAQPVREKAAGVRSEYVLAARGRVRLREGAVNAKLPTGEVEIAVEELRILGEAQTPPFEIAENSNTKEEIRLKYRFLDLRRPDLQRNILRRHRIVKAARDFFDAQGFIEIETPMLIKSTPEGARDFLVPSRLHPGEFYALPQSPQLFKQLCMVSGFDRSRAASATRICAPTGSRNSRRSTWRCPSSRPRTSWPWGKLSCSIFSGKSSAWRSRCPCRG